MNFHVSSLCEPPHSARCVRVVPMHTRMHVSAAREERSGRYGRHAVVALHADHLHPAVRAPRGSLGALRVAGLAEVVRALHGATVTSRWKTSWQMPQHRAGCHLTPARRTSAGGGRRTGPRTRRQRSCRRLSQLDRSGPETPASKLLSHVHRRCSYVATSVASRPQRPHATVARERRACDTAVSPTVGERHREPEFTTSPRPCPLQQRCVSTSPKHPWTPVS